MYYHPKCKRKWVNILNRARNISVSLRRGRDISITVIYQATFCMSLTVLYMLVRDSSVVRRHYILLLEPLEESRTMYMCTYRTIQYMYFYMTSHQYLQDFVCLFVNFSCCYKGSCTPVVTVVVITLCLLSLMIDHKLITEIT